MSSFLGSVDRLHAALDYHLARQNVLSSNLAQIDTPNFVPKDVARTGTFDGALTVAMKATDTRHLGASSEADGLRVINGGGPGAGADGNAVSLDREAAKVAANGVRYDAIAQLTADELSGLVWAANDGRMG